MSKDYRNGLYVDTGLLRDHVSKLREEKKLASRLYENVVIMKAMADPMESYRYDAVLRDVAQLIEYFDAMAKQLAHVEDEAVRLSDSLRGIIEDSTALSQRITDAEILL